MQPSPAHPSNRSRKASGSDFHSESGIPAASILRRDSRIGLDPAGPEPAEVGEAVEIAQNLGTQGGVALVYGDGDALRPAADAPGKIQGGAPDGFPMGGPAVKADFVVLLQIGHAGGQRLDHLRGDGAKT